MLVCHRDTQGVENHRLMWYNKVKGNPQIIGEISFKFEKIYSERMIDHEYKRICN